MLEYFKNFNLLGDSLTEYEKTEKYFSKMMDNGIYPMNSTEYDTCFFICSFLDKHVVENDSFNTVNIDNLYKSALDSFLIYDDNEILEKIDRIFQTSKVVYYDSYESTITDFKSIINHKKTNQNGNYVAEKITIPDKFNSLASVYFEHELHHILKDVYPNEYKLMLRYADVIPMFYELIKAENTDDLTCKTIINNRIALLYEIKNDFTNSNLYANSIIFTFLNSKKYQYLNSFYYSLLLYKYYKESPEEILKLVSYVLKGKITTLDLINTLGINNRKFDDDANNEFIIIKSKCQKS